MPMNETDIEMMKKLIDAARKKPLNFGFCLASKSAESAFYLDKVKSADILAKRAKKAAGGSKVAYGTASTSGKNINLSLLDDAPAGLVLGAKDFFKAHGLNFKVILLESDDDDAPRLTESEDRATPDAKEWVNVHKTISNALGENLSRLPERSSISAAWAMAQQKAEDEDFTGALKVAEKVERDYATACKAFATEKVKVALARFEKVKSILTNDDRIHLRSLVEPILKMVGKKPLVEVEKAAKTFEAEILKRAKAAAGDIDQRSKAVEDKLDQSDSKFKTELQALERKTKDLSGEVKGLNGQLERDRLLLKELPGKKGSADKKRIAAQKINDRIEQHLKDIAAKTAEVEEFNTEIAAQIQVLKEDQSKLTSVDRAILANIKGNVDAAKQEISANPFSKVKAKLDATIKEMGDALKWQEEQVARSESGENTHGTGRHGAQTGVEQQAFRAATGGAAPDSAGNEFGITQSIKADNGESIYWEEDTTTGERKIKSEQALQQLVASKIVRFFKSDKGSSFNTPVLEKAAVDKAVGVMNSKDWTEIYSNSKGWHDFLSVALVVEAPQALDLDGKSYTKSWGYSVGRKEAATMALGEAKKVTTLFEKGSIDENEMLNRLGVEKLLDGKALKKIPYATVVLERASVTSPWKSKTHYPNDTKTAESMDVAGRKVRNAASHETTASM